MPESDKSRSAVESSQKLIGAIYAKAFLGAVDKSGKTHLALEEFDAFIAEVLDKLPKLDSTLSSLRVPTAEKTRILHKAFGGKMSKELLNFLKVVCEHGRFDCLRSINRAAHTLEDERHGRVEVIVRTAEPLDEATRKLVGDRLRQLLGKEVKLKTETEAGLLGGMLVRVGDTVYDGSLANRLARLRQEAVERATGQIRASLERFVQA